MIARIALWLRTFGWDMHRLSGKYDGLSWLIHGTLALPLVLVVRLAPWTAPGLVFLYRDAEQLWFEFLNDAPIDWIDHVMDVLSPGYAGWYFLHGLALR